MSGKPLRDKSTEFISHIYRYTNGKFPIVGVGGIMNAQDAWEKITAGASLIQAYSGFVFEGPSLSKQIIKGLHKKLKEHNLTNIQDAVGLIHRSK
jgi:dihydroorotate dehydrogenase